MTGATLAYEALPPYVRKALDALVAGVTEALGEGPVGVVVHGPSARGQFRPNETDVDVLLVLRDVHPRKLEAIGEALQEARYAARIETTILSEADVVASRDMFPLWYDDVKRHHFVVKGPDPIGPSAIDANRERRLVQRSLRLTLVRLRRGVTDALGAPEAIAGAVRRRLRGVELPLLSFARTVGLTALAPQLVVGELGERYGVDTTPLISPGDAPDRAYDALVLLLTHVLDELATAEAHAKSAEAGT